MTSVSDKILGRVRAKGRGKWVCTPTDFLDFGSRAAVDQALSRLVKSGVLRRVGHGFYDLPRFSKILKRDAPVKFEHVVDAVVRRDGIRVVRNGIYYANGLGVTNAVPAKVTYYTDGATRNIQIGGLTIYLRHAGPRLMSWVGRTSAPVAMALHWLGPLASQDPYVARKLKSRLPDYVKKDLVRHKAYLPGWTANLVRDITAPYGDIN